MLGRASCHNFNLLHKNSYLENFKNKTILIRDSYRYSDYKHVRVLRIKDLLVGKISILKHRITLKES